MLQVHQRLGEFEIVRLLGAGGMGEVYEAQQDRPRRRVALKVLAPWLTHNADTLGRFWSEAETPAQLDHPGIVRIISTGQSEGIAYYTMNLVQGVSLADLIRRTHDACPPTVPHPDRSEHTPSAGAPFPTPARAESPRAVKLDSNSTLIRGYQADRYRTLARVGVMVGRALAYAHSRGCVHRDLKPANIMVDQHDQAYVLDFGLTRALDPDAVQSQAGVIIGTPWYMSPEQARGDVIDHRSDLYSLGVTLYELATRGSGPYACARDRATAVLAQVRGGQSLTLRSQAPDVPPALERIIQKAMSFQVEDRYPDAGQLADDLERYLAQGPAAGGGRGKRLARWRKPVLLAAAAALLALVILASGFWRTNASADGGPAHENLDELAAPVGKPQEQAEPMPGPVPQDLRDRKWRVPQSLLTVDHQPLWPRRLAGKGEYRRQGFQLMLSSQPGDDNPTLLALDNDPARRWFDYTVDLNTPLDGVGVNRIGVFFGWRQELPRCFVVEIDEHPLNDFPHGVARVGSLRVVPGGGAEAAVNEFRWIPGDEGVIPLKKSQAWHTVRVRVVNDLIQVTVDGTPSVPISMKWLARNQRHFAADLNPRGALGIWTYNGLFGSFRNAFVTALPEAEKGPAK